MPRNKKQEQIFKVVIGIPNEGHTVPPAYDNHLIQSFRIGCWQEKMRYEKISPRYEFYFYTVGRLLTQMAREKLMREALEGGADYLLMYDDDMMLPPDMAINMLKTMQERPEIDILGALAFMRSAPHKAVIYSVIEGYDSVRHQDYYFNQFYENYPRDTVVECDAVGFGAVCIKLAMVRQGMKEPYFMSTTATGEDIWFCVKAKREAKARVFMDTRIKLGHIANAPIVDEEFRDKYIKDNGEKIEDSPHKYPTIDDKLKSGEIAHKFLIYDR